MHSCIHSLIFEVTTKFKFGSKTHFKMSGHILFFIGHLSSQYNRRIKLLLFLLLLLLMLVTFMHVIYNYIPETNSVYGVCSVAVFP